jgi:Mn2+/Fe2+ NRAMP family transporter
MKLLKKYLITLALESLAVLAVLVSKDLFIQTEAINVYHILTDAFFAIGFITFGIGLLIFSSNEGVFDGLAFAVGSFINMFKKDPSKKYASLYEYRESKGERNTEFSFILLSGLAFLVISAVTYILYRSCK